MAELVIEAANVGRIQNSGGTYAAAHDAASGNSNSDAAVSTIIGQQFASPATFVVIRTGLEFSLTGLPTNAVITAATLSLYGLGPDDSDTDFNITLVSGVYLANPFVNADYGDLLNALTSYGALTTVGLLLEDWNVITLNTAGLDSIRTALTSGVIRFGVRSSRDISNTTPKLNGASADEYITLYGLTTNKKPKLTITYTGAPDVTTQPATDIATTTATGHGSIVSIGASSVTEHGHCWSLSVNPTTSDSKTTNGAGSRGTFTSSITGLYEGEKYYVRAYATNTQGTGYGANISFYAGYSGTQLAPGQIFIKAENLHYVSYTGIERYILGTSV